MFKGAIVKQSVVFLVFILSFFAHQQALAFKVDRSLMSLSFQIEKRQVSNADDYSVGYFLVCSQNSQSLCQSLCQNGSSCLLNEDACEACISSSELNLFSLTTDLRSVYQISKEQVNYVQLFQKFYDKSLMLMNANSIFNFLVDASDESTLQKLQVEFNSLCPISSGQSFLVVSSDPKNFMKLAYVICQSGAGSFIYQSEYSKEYDNH